MSAIKRILEFLVVVLRALLYGWLLALIELLRILRMRLQACRERLQLPGRLSKTAPERCVKVSDPAFKRPDPLIYDQYYLMSQGIAVTWDNPDIHIEESGTPVPSHSLKPDTVYDIVAQIWNSSTEAPVIGMPVDFSYLSFGIGTRSHHVGRTMVNLGVKGGPGIPAIARVSWRTPSTPGHYCVQVSFRWLDDANPNNNLGQTNTNVVAVHSPAEFALLLRNSSPRHEEYRFEVDSYTIPPIPPCDRRQPPSFPAVARLAPGTILAIPPGHDRRSTPLPAGWTVVFDPPHPALAPGDEVSIRVTVTPPAAFRGRQPLNVHALSSLALAGGVTMYIESP